MGLVDTLRDRWLLYVVSEGHFRLCLIQMQANASSLAVTHV